MEKDKTTLQEIKEKFNISDKEEFTSVLAILTNDSGSYTNTRYIGSGSITKQDAISTILLIGEKQLFREMFKDIEIDYNNQDFIEFAYGVLKSLFGSYVMSVKEEQEEKDTQKNENTLLN